MIQNDDINSIYQHTRYNIVKTNLTHWPFNAMTQILQDKYRYEINIYDKYTHFTFYATGSTD